MRLENKVAIVTGAGAGIGESIARRFAAEGARVLVADIDPSSAAEVAQSIVDSGGVADGIEVNVADDDAARRMAERAVERWSTIDILVNNAASFIHKRVEDATREDWQAVMAVNVIGTSFCTKHAVTVMKAQGCGSVVNVASINGLVAMPNWLTYNASKAAIVEMSKSMALDLAEDSIRVNCVCPGMTMTPSLLRAIEEIEMTVEEARRDILAPNTLIKRFGEPEEIAAAVLFLASDEASYVTGATLVVDGGWTA